MTHRLAIVASHVIQYQDPFFRLLAAEPDIDLTVLYCSRAGLETYRDADMRTTLKWDVPLLEGYRSVFLRNLAGDPNGGFWRLVNPGIIPAIARGRYDAVIFMLGWGAFSAMLGILTCIVTRTPFALYGDSSFPPAETSLRARIRAAFLRRLFAATHAFMTSGVLNAEYYAHYGADRRRFHLLPWAVDNDRFAAASRMTDAERRALRDRYDLGDRVAILFSAKLVERKDPMSLLLAYGQMRWRDRAAIVFMGDGPLRETLETYTRAHGLTPGVRFLGFVNQAEIPRHYAMCDVFVLPSLYEPRGAVINEAMVCGLPVVVTDRCGSIGDIVQEGDNAFIYPAGDATRLAQVLDRLVEDEALRLHMGRRSREIISTWNFARGVDGVKEMLGR